MPAESAIDAKPAVTAWRLRALLPALMLAGSRGAAMASQLLVQVAVGALSGPAGLGVLQLFTAWSNVLGEILARGWPPAVMKEVAVAWDRSDRSRGARTIAQASRALRTLALPVLLLSAVLALGYIMLASPPGGAIAVLPVLGALLGAVAFASMRIGAEALKAMNAPFAAITLENLAFPSVLLVVCAAAWVFDLPLNALVLTLAGVVGFAAGAVCVGRVVQRRLGQSWVGAPDVESPHRRRERRALWFSAVLAIAFLQLPFLVLPLFADTATIGVFAVAWKLVNVITTLLILLGSVFGPRFARAAADAERASLRTLLIRTQWLSVALYGPAALLLLATYRPLGRMFSVPGEMLGDFIAVLVIGQAINALTGLSGVLLCLTGAARLEWRISLGVFLLALLTVYPAGATYGAPGIAAWFSVVIALKNLATWAAARRHLTHGALHP